MHSNPNWAPNGSYISYEYESPLLPPDLHRIDVASKQVTQLTYSNPPAMQKNRKVMPEIVCFKSYDGLEIPGFLYKPEASNGAAIVYPHGGLRINMASSGMSLPNISPPKAIPISRPIIAVPQATANNLSV
jgi:dipeptidyl aminopeptidase/acylaminoacyl peptidase